MRLHGLLSTLVLVVTAAAAAKKRKCGNDGHVMLVQSSDDASVAVVYDESCKATTIEPVDGVLTAESMGIEQVKSLPDGLTELCVCVSLRLDGVV